jgi:hypothetical protein
MIAWIDPAAEAGCDKPHRFVYQPNNPARNKVFIIVTFYAHRLDTPDSYPEARSHPVKSIRQTAVTAI